MKNTSFDAMLDPKIPIKDQEKRLRRVIQSELTELQREAIVGVFFQGRKISDIARERGVNKSTICRTLKRAKEKLKRYLKY